MREEVLQSSVQDAVKNLERFREETEKHYFHFRVRFYVGLTLASVASFLKFDVLISLIVFGTLLSLDAFSTKSLAGIDKLGATLGALSTDFTVGIHRLVNAINREKHDLS